MSYRYRIVDVFTTEPLAGNPLAVIPNASGLDGATMQKVAREFNLSETTFVLPPTRDDCLAQVRIFTPRQEMAFAGHPTIGTSFTLIDEGRAPSSALQFTLDLAIGPVPIRVEQGQRPRIWLTTPPISWGHTLARGAAATAVGLSQGDLLEIPPQQVSAGNPTIFIAVKSKSLVDRADVDLAALRALRGAGTPPVCVFVFAPTAEGAYSRMFAPELGVLEDPATGSATGPLAAYMMRHQLVSGAAGTRFHSEQGTAIGRRSILYVQVNGLEGAGSIEVGGYVAPVAEGRLNI